MTSFLKKVSIYLFFFAIAFGVSLFNPLLGNIFYILSFLSILFFLIISANYFINDRNVKFEINYDSEIIGYNKNGKRSLVEFTKVVFVNKVKMNYELSYLGLWYDFYYFEIVLDNGESTSVSFFEIEYFRSSFFDVVV